MGEDKDPLHVIPVTEHLEIPTLVNSLGWKFHGYSSNGIFIELETIIGNMTVSGLRD